MNIFLCCSKHFYDKIPPIKETLEKKGHNITLPNSYDEPFKEDEVRRLGEKEHQEWKAMMIRLQETKIKANDAILVLNFEKKGMANYVGGATFLEMFKAFELGKKIFLYNPIPESILTDEIKGFGPIVIGGNLSNVN
ncbi:hypothetical protein HYT55_02595 [Candidatus Woesearchaeota archaeon]|nr:hypothetical protein [Candidatus Woesearchaeota archaeon]